MFGINSLLIRQAAQATQARERSVWPYTQEEDKVCPFARSFDSWPHMARLKRIVDHVTLFHNSCPHPHPPISELVKNRADGTTPLLAACNNGNLRYVKHIVEVWGADVNAYGSCYRGREFMEGVTPLFIAAANGEDLVVKYLIKKGADASLRTVLYIRGVIGMTPLDAARRFNDRRPPTAHTRCREILQNSNGIISTAQQVQEVFFSSVCKETKIDERSPHLGQKVNYYWSGWAKQSKSVNPRLTCNRELNVVLHGVDVELYDLDKQTTLGRQFSRTYSHLQLHSAHSEG